MLPVPLDRLEALAEEHGTPFYLLNEAGIRSSARRLGAAFSSVFPSARNFFAVKALPNPAVLRIVCQEGCGLDVSSPSELWIAQRVGCAGSDIMYTSNYTSSADLAAAFDAGVMMNLDDVSLVSALVKVRGRCPELISFRLNPGVGKTDSETPSNVLGGPDSKFGVPLSDIVDAYAAAKAAGSTRFGIHMMTGSCVMGDEYWAVTVRVLLKTVARIRAELGISFEFVNIGGGLGIPYRPSEAPVDVEAVAATVRAAFDECWPATEPLPKLYMEHGRYVTGPHGILVARCQAVKTHGSGKFFGLDACMADLMRPGMYGAYHHITVPRYTSGAPEEGKGEEEEEEANVVGTLCENNDWFAKKRRLPRASVGDLFVIHTAGAHAHAMGFQYNGKLRPPELLLRTSGEVHLIRRREVIDDLFRTTSLPSDLM